MYANCSVTYHAYQRCTIFYCTAYKTNAETYQLLNGIFFLPLPFFFHFFCLLTFGREKVHLIKLLLRLKISCGGSLISGRKIYEYHQLTTKKNGENGWTIFFSSVRQNRRCICHLLCLKLTERKNVEQISLNGILNRYRNGSCEENDEKKTETPFVFKAKASLLAVMCECVWVNKLGKFMFFVIVRCVA